MTKTCSYRKSRCFAGIRALYKTPVVVFVLCMLVFVCIAFAAYFAILLNTMMLDYAFNFTENLENKNVRLLAGGLFLGLEGCIGGFVISFILILYESIRDSCVIYNKEMEQFDLEMVKCDN